MYEANVLAGILFLSLFISMFVRKPVVLWGFHPMLALFFGKFWIKAVVYDCVDYYGEEEGIGDKLRLMERQVFLNATLVSFNSAALYRVKLSEASCIAPKSTVVPCGCDVDTFRGHKTISSSLKKIQRPRIGFVGHINHRIDFHLMRYVIKKHPSWSFIFVGPLLMQQPEDVQSRVEDQVQELKAHDNVYFLGRKSKKELFAFIRGMDVCIIPYDTTYKKVRYCNPMKAYEYLICEKPVVSTYIQALEDLHSPAVTVTKSHDEFSEAVDMYLCAKDKHQIRQSVQLAMSQSWEAKVLAVLISLSAKDGF